MGLIARELERNGIATTSISLAKELTESVGVPRAVFVKWPLGHPLGGPDNPAQQRTMLWQALRLLPQAAEPGMIYEPGYRWRREHYSEPDWSRLTET